MTLQEYLDKVNNRFKTGISTEHSYRGDLQNLLETLAPDTIVTNEPTRVACGAPDYIITRRKIPVGYIEAKDLGADLNNKTYKEQFDRYRNSLPNLIITNYLEFRLFAEGEVATTVVIADIQNGKVVPKMENFENFTGLFRNFCSFSGQTIKSPGKLAKMMAGKARLLANIIERALISDEKQDGNNLFEAANDSLRQHLTAFQQHLIHDITAKDFADIYAQTIAYGMFAARYHDPSLEDFSRQEAAELIPKTNPFLRKLFQYIAGYDLDDRIKWIVDELVGIFRATDVAAILNNFGKATQQTDPIIHFYETFLAEYDPKLRKSRGVWYTPEPVVNFIVRAVDDILKTEFGLAEGLADTSKTKIKVKEATKATADMRSKTAYVDVEKEVHKVQILDPACGTGTFLAEIVKQIYKRFEGQQGIWSQYVEDHLIPRLNGFELLMASYSMAHLKMDMLLHETGYKPKKDQRLRIYLTNSLEEYHPDTGTLFASWLSDEASEANRVKRDTPVMVVIGNPPYSGSSSNMSDWIVSLIEDYKDEKEKKRRGRRWVQDDYVKFIRFGQFLIDKNREGILAFINPHGFLDNPTFSGMRLHLLKSFDIIYTIDLHGNVKKEESLKGEKDDANVFDIMQGVSINIFINKGKKERNGLSDVFHFDLTGKREYKYAFLEEKRLSDIDFVKLNPINPEYFFKPKNYIGKDDYDKGFLVNKLFPLNTTGIVTAIDRISIYFSIKELVETTERIINSSNPYLEFNIKDALQSSKEERIAEIKAASKNAPTPIDYRPFDTRFMYYTKKTHGWINSPRFKVMKHLLNGQNICLMTCGQIAIDRWEHVGVAKIIADDSRISNRTKERGYIFPLYLYSDNNSQKSLNEKPIRTPNLKNEIINRISDNIGLTFTPEKEPTEGTFAPIDILDYIYAVLHSPTYREKYKEFLKIDFPRVPYPENAETFWQLVRLGGELRQLHLLESPKVNQFITTYPEDGTNEVGKVTYKDSQVWINDKQYFAGVPQVAWEFYIGGYQPAQKWLKDRKGRVLSFEDILHYQRIVVALVETERVMGEIDRVHKI